MKHCVITSLRLAILFVLVAGAISVTRTTSQACVNDFETQFAERSGMPDIDVIILGGFARSSDEYYWAKIRALMPQIDASIPEMSAVSESSLQMLDQLDDLAVAFDRVGESKQALELMLRKRVLMERIGYEERSAEPTNHWYRYFANVGTFRVHAWIKEHGMERKDTSELDQAIAEIEEAIEIYPDAHGGREGYQLIAMKWIRDLPAPHMRLLRRNANSNVAYLPDIMHVQAIAEEHRVQSLDAATQAAQRKQLEDAARGLAGLISLGAAWESVDVFYSLAVVLDEMEERASALLAMKRAEELALQDDRRSLAAAWFEGQSLARLIRAPWRHEYGCNYFDVYANAELRSKIRDWQDRRAEYEEQALKSGLSPADPEAFWKGFEGDPYFFRDEQTYLHDIRLCEPAEQGIWEEFSPFRVALLGFGLVMLLSTGLFIYHFTRMHPMRREAKRMRNEMKKMVKPINHQGGGGLGSAQESFNDSKWFKDRE